MKYVNEFGKQIFFTDSEILFCKIKVYAMKVVSAIRKNYVINVTIIPWIKQFNT